VILYVKAGRIRTIQQAVSYPNGLSLCKCVNTKSRYSWMGIYVFRLDFFRSVVDFYNRTGSLHPKLMLRKRTKMGKE
jgi:hypothetical protein